MVLDITKLINADGESLKIDAQVDLGFLSFNGQDIKFKAPVCASGKASSIDGKVYLDLKCRANYVTACSRCLEDTECILDFNVNEVYSKSQLDNENDDVIILNSNEIDLKEIIGQSFCCALPITCLCSEDCKGLCPMCGCNLNKEQCSCESDDIDPRLAVLKDFLK